MTSTRPLLRTTSKRLAAVPVPRGARNRRAPSVCAPYLVWIADWGHAVELAERGESRAARATATAAASALEAYGERYLAARLLVDLLPFLEVVDANQIAGDVTQRLEPMGAHSSAAEAGRWL